MSMSHANANLNPKTTNAVSVGLNAMVRNRSMGSHQSARMKNDEWLTPPEILNKLGEFDLDPCASVIRPWDNAKHHYTKKDDGLGKEWFGRIWLNPPYSKEAVKWLRRMSEHGNGIALTFARTETKWFFETIWNKADALLFLEGRIHFCHIDGSVAKANAGAPSVLIAYGKENSQILKNCEIAGKYIEISRDF